VFSENIEYIKNGISNRVVQIPEVKEAKWMAVRAKFTSYVGLIIIFVYNPPRNSRRYNPIFTKQSDGELK
jgi:hypothetical protein